MGYIDKDKKVRKKDTFLSKGDSVGKVKDKKAYSDKIFESAHEFGYIDDSDNVRQKDSLISKGRVIGKIKGKNKESALA